MANSSTTRIDLLAYNTKRSVEFWLCLPDNYVYMELTGQWVYVGLAEEFFSKLNFYFNAYKLVPTEFLKEALREKYNNPAKFREYERGSYISVSGVERRDVTRAWKAEATAIGNAIGSDEKTNAPNTGTTQQPDLFTILRSHKQKYSKT